MNISELMRAPQLFAGLSGGLISTLGLSFVPGVSPVVTGVAATLVFAGASLVAGRDSKKVAKPAPVRRDILGEVPQALGEQIKELSKLVGLYKADGSDLYDYVSRIFENSQELFHRINQKQDSQTHRMAAVNYTDTLTKLNMALSPGYYLDIRKNPLLWNRHEERMEAVRKAVVAVDAQIITNIQQVNASQDMEYEISLDSITKDMDTPQGMLRAG